MLVLVLGSQVRKLKLVEFAAFVPYSDSTWRSGATWQDRAVRHGSESRQEAIGIGDFIVDVCEHLVGPCEGWSATLSMSSAAPSFLKIQGTKIVDGDGKEVILRGAGLGGWMKCVTFAFKYGSCLF